MVGLVDFVGGQYLALGLVTRLVAVPNTMFLVVAIVSYHWQFDFVWQNHGYVCPAFWANVVADFRVRGGGA